MKKNFMELEVWQLSSDLAIEVFNLWEVIGNQGYYALRDQMQRAVLSISSNIAEGSERKSANEFVRFLYIAKGSAAEFRTQLGIFRNLKVAEGVDVGRLIEESDKISRKIQCLISRICNPRRSNN